MKNILGLDLGTNSIGWALVEDNFSEKEGRILGMGSRILPMDQAMLGDFEKGNSVSQTRERTVFRGVRRLRERHLLRRARLHVVLNTLGFLPEHYTQAIDFEKHFGQFKDFCEPKIAYKLDPVTGKSEFLFKASFNEMMNEFKVYHPELLSKGVKLPYDWTIYYLRKKALNVRIDKNELAWLILNFNQKRGYFQLRGEEEETIENKRIQYHALKVVEVIDSGDRKGKDDIWYNVVLENGWIYRRTSKTPLDWVGKTKEFVVTEDLNEDGSVKKDREGNDKRSFRSPSPDDWTLIKKKTEFEIEQSKETVGSYIYKALCEDPKQKIRGRLVSTIERRFYKEELRLILEKQKSFHTELNDYELLAKCAKKLYSNNDSHRFSLERKDFTHLIMNDIIFYQRPLKSKISLISDCRYESRAYKFKDGTVKFQPVKCIPKSHPLFQEFRLWQFLQNLRIYRKDAEIDGKMYTELDVTRELLPCDEDWVALFDWLSEKKEIKQETLLKYPIFNLKKKTGEYRWNYVEDKSYPANETRAMISNRLDKVKDLPENFLTREIEEHLWHILYSVEDKSEIEKALKKFATKHDLDKNFIEVFKKFPKIERDYGAYSAKAIKKLLPLMRMGKYWNEHEMGADVKHRIDQIKHRLDSIAHDPGRIDEITDDDIPKQVLKSFINCEHPMMGLNTYQACYAVYGRHSEEGEVVKWRTPEELDHYLQRMFKQHSLRNPIVEQVIAETLRVVRDIWHHFGQGRENFFDEIHVEMGREMKNPADKRKRISAQVTANENTNLRIKALLAELSLDQGIENVRPYSPAQQDILKIFEDGVINSGIELPEDILKISRKGQPNRAELTRYRLWLEQRYRSPYTGEVIPISKLFTPAYEIEHIIPQSRFFDDSLSNKVICEAEVNKDKDNATAFEYIRDHSGMIIDLSMGRSVKLFSLQAYQDFVKSHYSVNRGKMKKLLMEDIPDGFIARQINDTRYITKVVKNLLSNIVRQEGEVETTSKNVLASNGSITTTLKRDWGLNDVWNDIIAPRFERLNRITGSNQFGEWTNREGKRYFQIKVPLELQKDFDKKRIDHRHHAMDALVIACATRNHINYLNNEYAKSSLRFDLRSSLCNKDKSAGNGNYRWTFTKPWENFTGDAKEKLQSIIVSFKQNNRVINKTVNRYQKWQITEDGKKQKIFVKQEKGDHWAIRKPIHKDTVAGLVSLKFKKTVQLALAVDHCEMIVDKPLRKYIQSMIASGSDKRMIMKHFKSLDYLFRDRNISRVEIYFIDGENVASRIAIDESFSSKVIDNITDTGIRKILLNHLAKYDEIKGEQVIEHPELAFSPDGLEKMNSDLLSLNGGKKHKPIYKVRKFEPMGNKFKVGYKGNKSTKHVEAAKGTNLFFAIYLDKADKRYYESMPLNIVIERLKQELAPVPEKSEKSGELLFYLSPNDLVYVPSDDELSDNTLSGKLPISEMKKQNIYKMVSSSGTQAFFIRNEISSIIWNKVEFSPLNKMEKSIEGVMIKERCRKLYLDRLGNILNL